MAESVGGADADALYEEAVAGYGEPLERLARAYEADPENRRDLLQEIHLALWRSFQRFDQRCSLRTWIYQVAHNTAVSYVIRQRRNRERFVNLEEIEAMADREDGRLAADHYTALEDLLRLIRRHEPMDRQIILSYLEGMDAATTAEITGITPANVATKIHRIKQILARSAGRGGTHGE